MLNVNGKVDDSYRYKMPSIKSTTYGKGNGIFTIINNISDIGKYLNQPPNLLLKFWSGYYGAMPNEDKMSISGCYSSDELQKSLQVYINRFIICPKCGVPETVPQLKKESKKKILLELKCSSCGTISTIDCINKNETKACENIIKYLEKNDWIVLSKGTMVTAGVITTQCASNASEENDTEDDEINPFG